MELELRSFLLGFSPVVTAGVLAAAPLAAPATAPVALSIDPAWDDFVIAVPLASPRQASPVAPALAPAPVYEAYHLDFDFGGALLNYAGYSRDSAIDAAAEVIRARAAEIRETEDWARRIAAEAIAAAINATQRYY